MDLRDWLSNSKAYALQLLYSPPAVYSGRVLPGQPRHFEHIDMPVACGLSGGPVPGWWGDVGINFSGKHGVGGGSVFCRHIM